MLRVMAESGTVRIYLRDNWLAGIVHVGIVVYGRLIEFSNTGIEVTIGKVRFAKKN